MGTIKSSTYNQIKTTDRVHVSDADFDIAEANSVSVDCQDIGFKPNGLWYSIGTEWIDWVRSEMPSWESNHAFKFDFAFDNIKVISTYKELVDFEVKYSSLNTFGEINWGAVAKDYSGIEIRPYIWKARLKHSWYYGWDVASGCIWDCSIIEKITKFE